MLARCSGAALIGLEAAAVAVHRYRASRRLDSYAGVLVDLDADEPGPGGAEPPAPRKKKAKKGDQPKAQPRPRQQARNEKAGSVTKSVQEGRSRRFLGETVAELKKVTWPNRAQLFQATAPDFTPIYERVRAQPEILAGDVLPHEVIVPV